MGPRPLTAEYRTQQEACARAQEIRSRLWPQTDIGSGITAAALNMDKLKYDWDTLNLGRAAYSNNLQKGDKVFKGRSDWIVEDIRKDERSGFLAYMFKNEERCSIVLGIQGSSDLSAKNLATSKDTWADWRQDLMAYFLNRKPEQFDIAELYVRETKNKYENNFTIDCVGHSMGGGACAYSASQVPGVHGVALDPITSDSIKTSNASTIDNYVLQGEIADLGSRIRQRSSPGWYYQVFAPKAAPSGIANSTPAMSTSVLAAHKADLMLNALSAQSGLPRPELARP